MSLHDKPDFGRGDGDPLGGPDGPDADKPFPPDIYSVLVEFKVADRYYGVRAVRMTFVDPKGRAEDLLLELWRIWYGEETERLKLAGVQNLGTF